MSRRIVISLVKLLLLAALAGGTVYHFRFSPVPVAVQGVEKGTIVQEVMGTGTLEARVQSSVSTKIPGIVTVMEGDQQERVVKGQRLAVLDDRDLNQQVKVANADLEAKRAAVVLADAEIARAKASLLQAQVNYSRVEQLLKNGAIAMAEMDKALEFRDVADANLARAHAARSAADLVVIQGEEQLRLVQQRLADTVILAPYDALIINRLREPGDAVVPGSTLYRIISTKQIWVSAWVDESAIGEVAVGQPARIVFRSAPGISHPGRVARLGLATDRETREFVVDVDISGLPERWTVGQRAEVFIETARKDDVVSIPQSLISWRDGFPGVWTVQDGRASWRKIAIGLRSATMVEVTGGLPMGSDIISLPAGTPPPRAGRAVRKIPK